MPVCVLVGAICITKSPAPICPLGGGGYLRIRGCWFCSACAARFFIHRERRQSAVWLSPLERPPPTRVESVQVGEQLVAGHYGVSPAIRRKSPPSAFSRPPFPDRKSGITQQHQPQAVRTSSYYSVGAQRSRNFKANFRPLLRQRPGASSLNYPAPDLRPV